MEGARLDAFYVAATTVLAEHAGPTAVRERRDGVELTAVGHGNEEFNIGWVTARPRDPGATIGWACERLAGTGRPFVVQFAERLPGDVMQALDEHGLTHEESLPGMLLPATSDVPAPPDGLRVERVTDRAGLAAHVDAVARGFGAPDGSAMVDVFPASLLDDERVTMLNGYVDAFETPAVTGVGLVAGDLAGVFAIAVHGSARRRGFGTAITWAAIAACARPGVEAVTLQASAMGRPVYERMGFRTVREYHRYTIG